MNENGLRNYYVNCAKEYINVAEGTKRHTEIVNLYNGIKPLPMGYKLKTTDSWCAAFVSAMAAKCGLLDIIPAECSCPRQITLWQKMGRWMENDAYTPKAGDIIYYDWQDDGKGDNKGTADHVGIVCSVNGSTITVIEGNTSDKVGYRNIAVNGKYIRGYGLPDYASKATKEENEMFKDIKDSQFKADIERSVKLELFKGYGDGTFHPKEALTREMGAAIACRIYDAVLKAVKEGK